MPRILTTPVHDRPFHISTICSNKEWFKIPIEEVWSIMELYLRGIQFSYDVRVLNFVLMSNHFHLIAEFPQLNMGAAMNYFLRESSRCINSVAGRQHHGFKRTYFRSMINNYHYYMHAYKYIYRNPVEAGICKHVEDYKYSTLHSLLGQSNSLISVEPDETLFSSLNATMEWLNHKPKDEYREVIRRALRKSTFQLPKSKKGHLHPLELQLY